MHPVTGWPDMENVSFAAFSSNCSHHTHHSTFHRFHLVLTLKIIVHKDDACDKLTNAQVQGVQKYWTLGMMIALRVRELVL